jgi:hypothetical protein
VPGLPELEPPLAPLEPPADCPPLGLGAVPPTAEPPEGVEPPVVIPFDEPPAGVVADEPPVEVPPDVIEPPVLAFAPPPSD